MDEMKFLRELATLDDKLGSKLGDVREGVWRRIAREEGCGCFAGQGDASERFFLKMDIAAALMLAVGAYAAYAGTVSLLRDLYWGASTLSVFSYF